MAFVSINPNLIDVGDPVSKDLFDNIKNSLDDHESRIVDVEGTINKITVFNELFYNGIHTIVNGVDDIGLFRADSDFILTEAKVIVLEAGTAGNLQADLLKATSIAGPFTSVFSIKPSVSFASGSNIESSNAVFSTTSISAGDYLKLNIDSIQVSQRRFHIHIFGEAS